MQAALLTARAYDSAGWGAFFTAVITAAAGLTGLLFVAVSINLSNILKPQNEGLPARAAETLATLLLVVVTGALTLLPESTRLLGLEVLVLAGPLLAATSTEQLRDWRRHRDQPLRWTLSRVICTAVATVPATWAGISLAAQRGGGLYWLAAATLAGVVGAVWNAWVLLVEIIR